jgi:hypothetical protein
MMPIAEVSSQWQALFGNRDSLAIVCGCVMIVLLVAIPAIATAWHKSVKVRADAELKHAMIERGMPAEEIERVLQAKSNEK